MSDVLPDAPPEGLTSRPLAAARLATRADQRGRGLAQALMVDTFAVARGLYAKVGMQVTSTWVNRAIDLRGP